MHVIAIDLLQLALNQRRSYYVLVCVDHFSCFESLAPQVTKSVEAFSHALIIDVFCLFSTSHVLLSENGVECKNHMLKAGCNYFVIQTFIAAYHPVSNDLVERTNKK